jgi:chorismate mutase
MNEVTPLPGDPVDAARREIDAVDEHLLSLAAQRLQISDRLAALTGDTSGIPIRPGREIALLRKLIAAAPAPLTPEAIQDLWRVLIVASAQRQAAVEVLIGGGRGEQARLFDIARRHFGARVRIKEAGEPQMALLKAVENPATTIVVTAWPAAPGVGAWWPALTERRFQDLRLIAALPLMAAAEPEAALFAAAAPEEAGGDTSMLLAFDPHHRLQRALAEQNLVGKEVARAEPRVLVKVQGFMNAEDPRIAALTRGGLESVRLLGSYARI